MKLKLYIHLIQLGDASCCPPPKSRQGLAYDKYTSQSDCPRNSSPMALLQNGLLISVFDYDVSATSSWNDWLRSNAELVNNVAWG
jgi:hypothetical protein